MKGLTPYERRDLILSVGTHRGARRLSPLEVAQLIQKALDHGSSRKECSAALGVGTSQIGTFLKLLSLNAEVQHMAGWGGSSRASIAFSSLAELRRLNSADQVSVATAILKERLKWKEVIEVVQIRERSGKTVEECVADVVRRRPVIETQHVFIGRVDRLTSVELGDLDQASRDGLLQHVLAGMIGADRAFEGRLGLGTFTVVTQEGLLNPLGLSADEFEEAANVRIREARGSDGLSD